ncbi:ROK family protein [Nonomuraea jiangxiensis]|uniref:Sugar kinase of the NBD/HSP70 family, may contain an N-terminal HTH domain n=1 Tax=Nonomuraea jiangxiensis TaxID=633440 RepID=A0A1G7ZM28_9ACTN|nr:ROK family protein [Nonomuraea jiangxiensis]SDH09724.1 Sugar kinase of the NBD/HSP70 family, may contain an N-terminal HTH domain [Nonomuraea jiangxiensis]
MLPRLTTTPAATTVFTMVLTQGPVSRVEIAKRTGLSSAAVTKAARPFIEEGYLQELEATERTAPGAGRPASPLAIKPEREFFIGVKITNDELIGVVTDLRAQPLASSHRPLATTDVESVVAELAELVAGLLATDPSYGARCHALGLAVSGDVDKAHGLVRYSPFLGWRQVPLARLAAAATGLTVTVENDVKALTVAEQWFGDGVGASSFALVTVGVGIGCGLVVNGRVVAGAHGVAGEIGHIPVGGEEPECHCGGRGCVEAIAGTAPLVAAVRAASAADADDAVAGQVVTTIETALAAAHAGDPAVREVFARAGHAIGLAMAAMANLFGPERIIVTGDVPGLVAYDLFEEQINRSFTAQAFGAAADCRLLLRPRTFEQWARGAAAVAIQTLFTL